MPFVDNRRFTMLFHFCNEHPISDGAQVQKAVKYLAMCQCRSRKVGSTKFVDMCASVSQVGETGRTVGVEHIPELVERSIDAIKKTPAGALMETGRLVVHRMRLYASSLIFVLADILILVCGFSTLNLLEEQIFEFEPSAPL